MFGVKNVPEIGVFGGVVALVVVAVGDVRVVIVVAVAAVVVSVFVDVGVVLVKVDSHLKNYCSLVAGVKNGRSIGVVSVAVVLAVVAVGAESCRILFECNRYEPSFRTIFLYVAHGVQYLGVVSKGAA